MFIVRHRTFFFILTLAILVFSIGSMVARGLNFGIDFTGGSILEVSYQNARPDAGALKAGLDKLSLGNYDLRPTGTNSFVLRTKEISPQTKTEVLNALSLGGKNPAHEDRFNNVGPTVGSELRHKALIAIVLAIIGIVLFVTFAFRKVSDPVPSWKYGLATIIALVHDIIIPSGIFIFLTKWTGAEIDLLFMTALLAILGYSVHDTIVVFDRIRENLRVNRQNHNREIFEDTVGKSLTQTMGRSINTSLTIVLVLVGLYFIGGETTRPFSLLLLLGILAGTYSSIFLASPILVVFERITNRKS